MAGDACRRPQQDLPEELYVGRTLRVALRLDLIGPQLYGTPDNVQVVADDESRARVEILGQREVYEYSGYERTRTRPEAVHVLSDPENVADTSYPSDGELALHRRDGGAEKSASERPRFSDRPDWEQAATQGRRATVWSVAAMSVV